MRYTRPVSQTLVEVIIKHMEGSSNPRSAPPLKSEVSRMLGVSGHTLDKVLLSEPVAFRTALKIEAKVPLLTVWL